MKVCTQCNSTKSLDSFSKRTASKDGLSPICKPCRKEYANNYYNKNKKKVKDKSNQYYKNNKSAVLVRSKSYRDKNKEKIKDRNKHYREANQENIKCFQSSYCKSDHGKKVRRKASRKYATNNQNKKHAHRILNNALRDKKITKPWVCEECNTKTDLCGHHPDYAKPLEVNWLCKRCHINWHKVNGEGLNG